MISGVLGCWIGIAGQSRTGPTRRRRRRKKSDVENHAVSFIAVAAWICVFTAHGATFIVHATDDIFLSGGNLYTSAGGGIGNAPSAFFAVGSGGLVTFSNVTGTWSCCSGGATFNGPDGNGFVGGSTNLQLTDGKIAGIEDTADTMFVVGLFLGSALPLAQPSTLDLSSNENFSSLSPGLGQPFFIGDGLTGRRIG